jgi:hypothetical protein
MGGLAFRMYFGSTPATTDQLGQIEEIEVDQEMDMAWEARIRVSVYMNDDGTYHSFPRDFAAPFSRIRVELTPNGTQWTPLIDGPVAAYDSTISSQPGRSTLTIVVHDDSVLMDREEAVTVYEQRPDDDIAREVFGAFLTGPPRIQAVSGAAPDSTVRRGTAIQFVRNLARANNYRAYVLPGDQAGQSIGCFLPDPTEASSLPPLSLFGATRSLSDVTIQENSDAPQRTAARTLRISDQQVVSIDAHVQDADLMRPLPPISDDTSALRLVPPEDNTREDPESRARAATARSAYAYRAQAKVVPTCYTTPLGPYQRVAVQAGPLPYSGDWLLKKVTHRITPSIYTQEIEALCNAQSPTDGSGSSPASGLSAALSGALSLF